MPTRSAVFTDLRLISSIFAASFLDEEVVGGIMHPNRQLYPQDYVEFWRRRVLENYWDYSHKFVVFYLDGNVEPDGEEGTEDVIVGVADWQRMGRGWEGVWGVWGWWDIRNLIRPLVSIRNRAIFTIWPNRAADPTQLDLMNHMYPFITHLWSGPRANCWDLHGLAVAPAYQNRGYGRQLVKWGLEQAEREGVAASVLSAEGRERFYQRCGYVDVVGRATDGVGNPLAGRVRGGVILFRDPEDRER